MTPTEILTILNQHHIEFQLTKHPAVTQMTDATQLDLPYSHVQAKNLFIVDQHNHHEFLVTVKDTQSVDLKGLQQRQGTTRLTFGSLPELQQRLGVSPGTVSPLGLLNDTEKRVHWLIDQDFLATPGIIGVHPNVNTATIWLKTADLMALIRHRGHLVTVDQIPSK